MYTAGNQADREAFVPAANSNVPAGSEPAYSQEQSHGMPTSTDKPHEARKYTAKDWESQRPEITRLYEENTLDVVMKFMREKHGLYATYAEFVLPVYISD